MVGNLAFLETSVVFPHPIIQQIQAMIYIVLFLIVLIHVVWCCVVNIRPFQPPSTRVIVRLLEDLSGGRNHAVVIEVGESESDIAEMIP